MLLRFSLKRSEFCRLAGIPCSCAWRPCSRSFCPAGSLSTRITVPSVSLVVGFMWLVFFVRFVSSRLTRDCIQGKDSVFMGALVVVVRSPLGCALSCRRLRFRGPHFFQLSVHLLGVVEWPCSELMLSSVGMQYQFWCALSAIPSSSRAADVSAFRCCLYSRRCACMFDRADVCFCPW